MANVPLITAWESATIYHKSSSFETTFTFNGNTVHATGFYSFDGYCPNITDIAFLDSEFLAPEIGVAHEKDLRAEIEVELRERYQVEMYAEWERFNGPDEHGDY